MEKFISLSRKNFNFSFYKHKKKIIKEKGLICQKCGKEMFYIQNFTLDHIIPVKVGGPAVIWDKENLWLLCRECNCEKLSKDRTIMHEMVKLGFFSKGTNWHTLFKSQEECVEYYKRRFEKLSNL